MAILKDNCFKVDIHLMPDLPFASPDGDVAMFDYVYNSPDIQADQIKIYPCEITPYTVIQQWYKTGKYTPYAETNPRAIVDVVKYAMVKCPPWIRLPRVVRDIPTSYIEAGNMNPNLRQIINDELKQGGLTCDDLRTREAGRHPYYRFEDAKYIVRKYDASGGTEYFISLESIDKRAIFGFIRLRIPNYRDSNYKSKQIFTALHKRGLIRELHVYGNLIPVGVKHKEGYIPGFQHKGIGKRLLLIAETVALFNRVRGSAVISGEGVREYYRKLGYTSENADTFMIKNFDSLSWGQYLYYLAAFLPQLEQPLLFLLAIIDPIQDLILIWLLLVLIAIFCPVF